MRKLLLGLFIFVASMVSLAETNVKVLYINTMGNILWSSISKKIEDNINEFLLINNNVDIKNIDIEKTEEDIYLVIITYKISL